MGKCAHDPWYRTIIGFAALVAGMLYTSYEAWMFFQHRPQEKRTLFEYGKMMLYSQSFYLIILAQDFALLNAPWSTVETASSIGFSKLHQIIAILTNALITKPLMHFIFFMLQDEMSPRTDDLFLQLFKIIGMFIISDICFTVAHRWMHQSGWSHHVLHHCVHHSSAHASWFVEPIDFLAEFGPALAPTLLVLGTPIFGLRDPWVCFVSLVLQEVSYALGHDAFLKLAHYNHHAYISGTYWIYYQKRTKGDGKDKIRTAVYGESSLEK